MTSIFVGNLSYEVSDSDLRDSFSQFGYVSSAQVMTDRGTGKSRGFGFVRMPRLEDADEAIVRMNGKQVRGRAITVAPANDRDDDEPVQLAKPVNILDLI